ncbi:MAG: CBS domain-containing protein [Bdellovibrionales bacterium]|nr:CBS domain-containing protein [Bdellovibrionales bacterium]
MSSEIHGVPLGTPISDVIMFLQDTNTGSVIVLDENDDISGIVTERDLVRRYEERQEGEAVENFMTHNPEVIRKNASLARGLYAMSVGGFRHLPVVHSKKFVEGMLSVRNVVSYIYEKLATQVSANDCEIIGKAEVVKRYFCSSVSILAPHQPVKVLPTSTISEVLQILRKSKIGSVLVSGENRDFGIFTERDYVKKVLGSERDLSKDPVSDFMSSPLVGIADDLSVLDAYQKLSGKSIRHLPVVGKDGRVSSMLSVKDFMDTLAQGIVAELEQKQADKK